jgi:CDP-4-dehydro-6-deoxyglucose reductase, E1
MWKLAEDTISAEDLEALRAFIIQHPRLTQGPEVRAFEAEWSTWLGTEDSVMVTSGTTANFALTAVALGRVERRPARVGVAAVTWPTNITPALLLGCEVVVFDVDPATLGANESAVCSAMEEGAIDILFVTHLLGFNALTPAVVETAERTGVVLMEDCCESHGAKFGDVRIGTLGIGSSFSFYFGHHMSTIEGGIVSTNDPGFADAIRLMRAHGLARESRDFDSYTAQYPDIHPQFLFVSSGLNFRSTELNAFLGRRQLTLLDERIRQRNANLHRLLEGAPAYLWSDYDLDGVSSFALPLIAGDPEHAAQVKKVVDRLGIESRPVVAGNLLRQPFMSDHRVHIWGGTTPVADHVHACGIYVGNGHHVTPEMVDDLLEGLAAG